MLQCYVSVATHPDLTHLLHEPGRAIFVLPGEPDEGYAGPCVARDARMREPFALRRAEDRFEHGGQIHRRSPDLQDDLVGDLGRREGTKSVRLLVRERPNLPELLEEEGDGLRLGVYATRNALQQHRQQFLVLVVVQLDRRSFDLRMNYSLRRRLRLLGFSDLDGHGAGRAGTRVEAEVGVGDDTQGAQGAGEELREVVAGHVLDDLAASFGYCAVVQDDGYADDQVSDGAVPVPSRPGRVGSDYSADGGPALRRVYGEHLVRVRDVFLEIFQLDPGLETDDLVSRRVLQHLVHPRGAYDEVEPARRVAGVHLRAAAPGRDGQALAGSELHHVADLLDGARLNHEVGFDALDGVLFRRLAEVVRADYAPQVFCKSLLSLHQNCSTIPAFCKGCMWKGPGRSPQRRGGGKILPGVDIWCGSNAHRRSCMTFMSSSVNILGMYFFSALSASPSVSLLYRTRGCKFPSPAWKTLATRRLYSPASSEILPRTAGSSVRGMTPSWT